MANRIVVDRTRPDWQRVTALGASFLAHGAAALVIALPVALHTRAVAPVPIVASMHAAPPPLPPPPAEPVPPTRTHPVARTAPVVPVALPVPERGPIEVAATTTMSVSDPLPAPSLPVAGSVADGAGAGGPSRRLAYDGVLKLRYPPLAVRQRLQGRVLLNVLVDAEGQVQRIEVARSSGHADLDNAARDAVQRAHFRPVLRDGVAEPAWGVVPIEFRLDHA